MSVFTVHLEESINMTDADKAPLIEDMTLLDTVNGGISDAHISLAEAIGVLEAVAYNWTGSTIVDINAGEYLFAEDSVVGYKRGVLYTEYVTEAIAVLDSIRKLTEINLSESFNINDILSDGGGRSLIEKLTVLCAVTATSGISLIEVFNINETLINNILANRNLNSNMVMEEFLAVYKISNGVITLVTCPEPIIDYIYMELFSDVNINVTVKLPEFGDEHKIQTSIIRSEDIYIRRDLDNSKITMSFNTIINKNDLVDFYNNSRGGRIKFTDQYNINYVGYLTNSISFKEDSTKDGECGDYSTELVFEGKRI